MLLLSHHDLNKKNTLVLLNNLSSNDFSTHLTLKFFDETFVHFKAILNFLMRNSFPFTLTCIWENLSLASHKEAHPTYGWAWNVYKTKRQGFFHETPHGSSKLTAYL